MVFKDHFDLSQATIQTQANFFLQKYGPTIVNQFFSWHNLTETIGTQIFDWTMSSQTKQN